MKSTSAVFAHAVSKAAGEIDPTHPLAGTAADVSINGKPRAHRLRSTMTAGLMPIPRSHPGAHTAGTVGEVRTLAGEHLRKLAGDHPDHASMTEAEITAKLATYPRAALEQVLAETEAEIRLEESTVEAKREHLEAIREVIWHATDTALQMRVGSLVWGQTYAKGKGRIEAYEFAGEAIRHRIEAVERDSGEPFDWSEDAFEMHRSQIAWSAAWAIGAFPTVTTAHTFAAALMCTDVYAEIMADVRSPWPAWRLLVPNGLLKIEGEVDGVMRRWEIVRIDVEEHGGMAMLRVIVPSGLTAWENRAPSLSELLAEDPTDVKPPTPGVPGSYTELGIPLRLDRLVRRYVAGVMLAMLDRSTVTERVSKPKPSKRPGRGAPEPEHRNVTVGAPTRIDARPEVAAYLAGRTSTKRGPAAFRWLVRGHWRNQVCGVGRTGRKKIWIQPHWSGSEDGPILSTPKVIKGPP